MSQLLTLMKTGEGHACAGTAVPADLFRQFVLSIYRGDRVRHLPASGDTRTPVKVG